MLYYYTIAILMLPTVIFQAIPLILKKNTAPLMSYIVSLVWNIGYGLIIGGEGGIVQDGIMLIIFAAIMTIFPFDKCFCSSSFHGNHLVFREIFSKPLSRSEFIEEMCRNRALPPCVTVHGEAYHYETRTEVVSDTDSDGHTSYSTRTYTEEVVTFTCSRNYDYQSWQEEGNSIRIKDTDIVHAVVPVKYEVDNSAQNDIDYLRDKVRAICRTRDFYTRVSTRFSTPGIRDSLCANVSTNPSRHQQFYQGTGGRILWFLFTIIGYQSAFESFWNMAGERMRLTLRKKISGRRGTYRCGYGEEDPQAAMTTFRVDSGPVEIITSPPPFGFPSTNTYVYNYTDVA